MPDRAEGSHTRLPSPSGPATRWLFSIAVVGAAAAACTARGRAGAQLETGGTVNLEARGSVEARAEARVEAKPEGALSARLSVVRTAEGTTRIDYGKRPIHFEYDKADLQLSDDETRHILEELRDVLKKNPEVELEIQGHTDSRGSPAYNLDLSERRAAALRDWLVAQGIVETRLTSIGKGEEIAKAAEPDECRDKEPADTKPCEEPWQESRRVVFEVPKGANTLQTEPEPPKEEPVAEKLPPPRTPEPDDCPTLAGPRGQLMGPVAQVGAAMALQPGVCWVELSLGAGFRVGHDPFDPGSYNAHDTPSGVDAQGMLNAFPVLLGARLWLGRKHAFIADANAGFVPYFIRGTNNSSGTTYTRDGFVPAGALGVGYGYRNDPFRLGILGGVMAQGRLGPGKIDAPAVQPSVGAALQEQLDDASNEATDRRWFVEVTGGWMFWGL